MSICFRNFQKIICRISVHRRRILSKGIFIEYMDDKQIRSLYVYIRWVERMKGMEEFLQMLNTYIDQRLWILIPVLYVIVRFLDGSKLDKRFVPIVLLAISVALTLVYMLATMDISSFQKLLLAVFCAIVQGVLISGAAVFGGILMQSMKKKEK